MRIGRYFAGVAGAATALVYLSLVVLVVAVTLVESAGDISDAEAAASAALYLAVYSAVPLGYQVLPIACFMGALVAGTVMARRGEILAAQAAGVSSLKLVLAFLTVVVVAALGGAACGEVLVPRAVSGVERVQREQLGETSALTRFYKRRLKWFREGDLLVYLPAIDRRSQSFEAPVVYRFVNGLITEVIEGERMRHDGQGWFLENARIRTAEGSKVVEMSHVRLELTVRPTDLMDVTGDPRQMSSEEVEGLIGRRKKAGFDTTSHRIELHNRFALPLSAIWMFLFVAPWSLHPERRRSLARALGGGVVCIALLLSINHVFRLLALGHKIPVPLGAWGGAITIMLLLPLSVWAYNRYRVRGWLW